MIKKDLYLLMYDFLAIRIKTGYYKNGDQIRIKPLADFFHVSTITIRKAFTLLEQSKYIQIEKNQRAVVTYNTTDVNQISIPLLSWDTLYDIHAGYQFILSEIIWHALHFSYEAEQLNIREYIKEYNSVSTSSSVLFLKTIIEAFGNPLLLEHHIDIFLFTYPTEVQIRETRNDEFQSFSEYLLKRIHTVLDLYEAGKYEETYKLVQLLYPVDETTIKSATANADVFSFPFRWNKSQVRYRVASDFIVQIYAKRYLPGDLTPSMSELAKYYNVSYMTIRRAFSLLNNLGVVETINGVGTRILTSKEGSKKIQWHNQEVRKHMLSFLYTLQILTVTAKKFSISIIDKLSEEQSARLIRELQYTLNNKISSITFGIWLQRVVSLCEYRTLADFFDYLTSLLVWGYPLRYLEKVRHFPNIINGLIHAIENKDAYSFAHYMESYCYIIFVRTKEIMIELGIDEAKQVKTPKIDVSDIIVKK